MTFEGNKHYRVSRVSWILENGPIPDNLCVLHECDNPRCVCPDHLFLGTLGDNNTDRSKKGRSAAGEASGQSKLTEANVAIIRKGGNRRALAARFDVSGSTISAILLRKTWRHVP